MSPDESFFSNELFLVLLNCETLHGFLVRPKTKPIIQFLILFGVINYELSSDYTTGQFVRGFSHRLPAGVPGQSQVGQCQSSGTRGKRSFIFDQRFIPLDDLKRITYTYTVHQSQQYERGLPVFSCCFGRAGAARRTATATTRQLSTSCSRSRSRRFSSSRGTTGEVFGRRAQCSGVAAIRPWPVSSLPQ